MAVSYKRKNFWLLSNDSVNLLSKLRTEFEKLSDLIDEKQRKLDELWDELTRIVSREKGRADAQGLELDEEIEEVILGWSRKLEKAFYALADASSEIFEVALGIRGYVKKLRHD